MSPFFSPLALTLWSANSLMGGVMPEGKPNPQIRVMSYNVQNLFDTVDDPNTNDTEFTPNGSERWTNIILSEKIQNISKVIRSINPDILGLTELETQGVLNKLVTEGLSKMGYQTVIAGPTEDARGIRPGLISRFPAVNVKSHRVWKDSWRDPRTGKPKKTRDILEVTLDTRINSSARFITVLVNHWPSRASGEAGDVMRAEVAVQATQIVAQIAASDPNRRIILIGDFNDDIRDYSFNRGARLVNQELALNAAGPGAMFATSYELENLPPEQRGTFYFERDRVWNALDHIFVAGGQQANSWRVPSFHYVPNSLRVVRHPYVYGQGIPLGCELSDRRRAGNPEHCLRGAADHLPLAAIFELR